MERFKFSIFEKNEFFYHVENNLRAFRMEILSFLQFEFDIYPNMC